MDDNTNKSNLDSIKELLKGGNFSEAHKALESLFTGNYDNKAIEDAYRCSLFWTERFQKLQSFSSDIEKADYLNQQWSFFQSDFSVSKNVESGIIDIFKHNVFTKALEWYTCQKADKLEADPDILFRRGQCYKFLGEYDKAINSFEEAARSQQNWSELLAELADCYAMLQIDKPARVLFREAFYIDPQKIDIFRLESELIRSLINKVEELGFKGKALREWVPVYGVILGVFNVKREFRAVDYGNLQQDILSLKKEIKESEDRRLLTPRLINKYFWLVDYYIIDKKPRKLIEEALMNIKLLSPEIYKHYTNG